MKALFILSLCLLMLSAFQCQKGKPATSSDSCFKGKLVKKGICMNYTISVTGGNIDTALIETSWIHPNTGKTYTNAFGLSSPCGFPAGIAEGQEFYFKINPTPDNNCVVCMAFEPTPAKKLAIQVINEPCP